MNRLKYNLDGDQVVTNKKILEYYNMMNKTAVVRLVMAIWLSILFLMSLQSSAYTTSLGIEDDDEVNLDYILTYDGQVQEEGPGFVTKVNPEAIIQGFYEGLLGMKLGEEKQIVVPPHKGYNTAGHPLEGKTLYFDVLINSIVSNIRGDDYDIGTEGGVGTTLQSVGNGILIVGSLGVVYLGISGFRNRITVPNCAHCAIQGRSVKSEGTCGSCGEHYCRSSFAKGCPNCHSNTLIPMKK